MKINPYFLQVSCNNSMPFDQSYDVQLLNSEGKLKFMSHDLQFIMLATAIAITLAITFQGQGAILASASFAAITIALAVQTAKKFNRATINLSWVEASLENLLTELGIAVSPTTSTDALYRLLRDVFYKKAAVIKYWEKNNPKIAEAHRAHFHILIDRAMKAFGVFDTTGGFRSFFGEMSDKVMVKVKYEYGLNITGSNLDLLMNTEASVEVIARAIHEAVTRSNNDSQTAEGFALLIDDPNHRQIVLHEYSKIQD